MILRLVFPRSAIAGLLPGPQALIPLIPLNVCHGDLTISSHLISAEADMPSSIWSILFKLVAPRNYSPSNLKNRPPPQYHGGLVS
jgi:hypothetical protein